MESRTPSAGGKQFPALKISRSSSQIKESLSHSGALYPVAASLKLDTSGLAYY